MFSKAVAYTRAAAPGRATTWPRVVDTDMPFLRTLVALARPALLPTVWSNCIAGWWLGGGGHLAHVWLLFASSTLIYLGGTFLHDVFDAEYDQIHHVDRPIPARGIAHQTAWRWGLGMLLAGAVILFFAGSLSVSVGLALALVIVIGNATHRPIAMGPAVDGLCRALLYVLGASFAERGLTGGVIWCGAALGCYRMGVGFFALWRNAPAKAQSWPAVLFAVPVAMALIMDAGRYRESGLLLSGVLALWVLRCLRQTFWSMEPSVERTVQGLLAGIVFVDWLATCPLNIPGPAGDPGRQISIVFLLLFGLTLGLQKLLQSTSAAIPKVDSSPRVT